MFAMPEDRQTAFPFVVMLHMEGRWRLVRDGVAFDPDTSPAVNFENGTATITRFQHGDGGRYVIKNTAPFVVAGGRLTIEFEREDGFGSERYAGAALADPDVLQLIHTERVDFGDGPEVTTKHYMLVREELVQALHAAEAQWASGALNKMH